MKKPVVLSTSCLLLLNLFLCNPGTDPTSRPKLPGDTEKLSLDQYYYIVNSTYDTIFVLKILSSSDSNLSERVLFYPHPYILKNDSLKIMITAINLSTNKVIPVYGIFQRYSGTSLQGIWVKESSWFDTSFITNSQDSARFYSALPSSMINKYIMMELDGNTLKLYKSPDSDTVK